MACYFLRRQSRSKKFLASATLRDAVASSEDANSWGSLEASGSAVGRSMRTKRAPSVATSATIQLAKSRSQLASAFPGAVPGCICGMISPLENGNASIDLDHDEADIAKKVECPLLTVWGGGPITKNAANIEAWRERAKDVRGFPLDCGHFLAEERPQETADALRNFFLEK